MSVLDNLKHAWNAFTNKTPQYPHDFSYSSFSAHHLRRTVPINKSQFVSSVYNRIAMDVSAVTFNYVSINKDNGDRTVLENTYFNRVLTKEANIDQTHKNFIQDIVFSMLDEGVVAVVPVDTTLNPNNTESYDIMSMRTGRIVEWRPRHVVVNLYNEETGQFQDVLLPKKNVAIIENPISSVTNNNTTLNRLLSKMSMVDDMDKMLSSGRLDILVQMPHTLKTEKMMANAKERIESIEKQMSQGSNGIAYIDATEKIIQLNRPANSQVVENVKLLKEEFYNQIGLTQKILDGSASEDEMRFYFSRTIDPIVDAICDEFSRKFISKKAYTMGYRVVGYRDFFKLISTEKIANLTDTLRRNGIATANEVRKILGLPPSNDPAADMIGNPNMPASEQLGVPMGASPYPADEIQKEDNLEEMEYIDE